MSIFGVGKERALSRSRAGVPWSSGIPPAAVDSGLGWTKTGNWGVVVMTGQETQPYLVTTLGL